jgi:ABC-type nitrate/sulfonate/bicarbonate transport system permease component
MNKKVELTKVAIFVVILLMWQLAPTYHLVNTEVLSPLSKALAALPQLNDPGNPLIPLGGILPNLYTTLYEIAIALAISTVVGLVVGFCIGYYKRVGDAYEPLVYAVNAIPAIVLYPILYLTFGFGSPSKIGLAVITGAFPLIIIAAAGFRQVKTGYVKFAKSLGATDRQILFKVLLPAAGPNIMSGIRLALGSVVISVIVAEILASRAGLGTIIDNAAQNLSIDQMYATIILVIIIAYGAYLVITQIEKRVLPYARK